MLSKDKPFVVLVAGLKATRNSSHFFDEHRLKENRSMSTWQNFACCKLGDFLDEALRYRLACGLSSEGIHENLLTEADLTLETLKSMENSIKSVASVKACHRRGRTTHDKKDGLFKYSRMPSATIVETWAGWSIIKKEMSTTAKYLWSWQTVCHDYRRPGPRKTMSLFHCTRWEEGPHPSDFG